MGELKAKKNRIFDRFQGKLNELKHEKEDPRGSLRKRSHRPQDGARATRAHFPDDAR